MVNDMTIFDDVIKIANVISSCETTEHLKVAENMLNIYLRRNPNDDDDLLCAAIEGIALLDLLRDKEALIKEVGSPSNYTHMKNYIATTSCLDTTIKTDVQARSFKDALVLAYDIANGLLLENKVNGLIITLDEFQHVVDFMDYENVEFNFKSKEQYIFMKYKEHLETLIDYSVKLVRNI